MLKEIIISLLIATTSLVKAMEANKCIPSLLNITSKLVSDKLVEETSHGTDPEWFYLSQLPEHINELIKENLVEHHQDSAWSNYFSYESSESADISEIKISRDNKIIAIGLSNGKVKLYNIETNTCIMTLTGHTELIDSICISHNNKYLATSSLDKKIKFWELETGQCLQTVDSDDPVISLSIQPNNYIIALCNDTKLEKLTIKLFNIETGKIDKCITRSLLSNTLKIIKLNDSCILFGSKHKEAPTAVLNAKDFTFISIINNEISQIYSAGISQDHTLIATGLSDGIVKIWDTITRKCISTLAANNSHYVTCTAISSDNKFIVIGLCDGSTQVFDIQTGNCIREIIGNGNPIESIIISSDNKFIVTKTYNKIDIFNVPLSSSISHILEKLKQAIMASKLCPYFSKLVILSNPEKQLYRYLFFDTANSDSGRNKKNGTSFLN